MRAVPQSPPKCMNCGTNQSINPHCPKYSSQVAQLDEYFAPMLPRCLQTCVPSTTSICFGLSSLLPFWDFLLFSSPFSFYGPFACPFLLFIQFLPFLRLFLSSFLPCFLSSFFPCCPSSFLPCFLSSFLACFIFSSFPLFFSCFCSFFISLLPSAAEKLPLWRSPLLCGNATAIVFLRVVCCMDRGAVGTNTASRWFAGCR